jgi:hypothetical protein
MYHTNLLNRLYYRYQNERLPLVPLTVHALVHTALEIVMTGPKGILWEFVSERVMGLMARSVTSKRFPFSQLSNSVLRTERFKMLQYLYDLTDEDLCLPSSRNLEELSGREMMIHELSK